MAVDQQAQQAQQPQRNPNLIERIAAAVRLRNPGVAPPDVQRDSTNTGVMASTARALMGQFLNVENTRRSVYRDVDEMDDTSEETSTALDTIADNVCTSEDGAQMSWSVHCEDDTVQQALEDMAKRTNLHQQTYGIVRNLVKRGDVFSEIVVNPATDGVELWVSRVKQLPPSTMLRNQLKNGEQPMGRPNYADGKVQNAHGECAFEQIDDGTGTLKAVFYPWQIAHFRHNWDGETQYGRSMMKTSRQSWRKLLAEEQSLVIGRLMRAFMKLVWYVDTTGLSRDEKIRALKSFQDSVQVSQRQDVHRDAPFSVLNDIFVADAWVKLSGAETKESRTRVQPIDPKNEGMTNIADVEYIANKLLSTLRVPKAHMGFERDVNAKATLTTQDVQYVRFLRRVQQEVGQVLTQICDTQLIVLGLDPASVDYTIEWPRLSASDEAAAADSEFSRAQTDEIYLEKNVIDAEWVMRERLGMDDEAVAEMQQRIATEQQQAQAQQQAQQQQQMEVQLTKLKAMQAAAPVANGNGSKPAVQELHELRRMVEEMLRQPVVNRGGHSQEARLLAEAIKSRVDDKLVPYFEQVEREQAETRQLLLDQFGGFHPNQPRGQAGQFASSGSGLDASSFTPQGIAAAISRVQSYLKQHGLDLDAAVAHAKKGKAGSHKGGTKSHSHAAGSKLSAAHARAHQRAVTAAARRVAAEQKHLQVLQKRAENASQRASRQAAATATRAARNLSRRR